MIGTTKAPASGTTAGAVRGRAACLVFAAAAFVAPWHESSAEAVRSWGDDVFSVVSTTPEGDDFVAIAAAEAHSVALRADGSIVSWGDDTFGQKTNAPGGTGFEAVAAAGYHNFALRADGSIAAWGIDDFGQVSTVPGGMDFVAIAAGYGHGLALRTDGSIAAWGWDGFNQTGDAPPGNGFAAIAAGQRWSMALRDDGSIVAWGDDFYEQVSGVPVGTDFVAISAGAAHGLALKADGSIAGWGADDHGQATPPAGNDFVAIAAGTNHNLALRDDGSIVQWGWEDVAPPPAGMGFVAVAAGTLHNVALGAPSGPPPPVPTIVEPLVGAIFAPDENIIIRFTLEGDDSSLDRVEVWSRPLAEQEFALLGPVSRDPANGNWFPFSWSLPPVGSLLIRVRAVNDDGRFADSEAVGVEVTTSTGISKPRIVAPAHRGVADLAQPVVVRVEIPPGGAPVTDVEILSEAGNLGAATLNPVTGEFEFVWPNATFGVHTLTALAQGGVFSSTSDPVEFLANDSTRPFQVHFTKPAPQTTFIGGSEIDFDCVILGNTAGLENLQFWGTRVSPSHREFVAGVQGPVVPGFAQGFSWDETATGNYIVEAVAYTTGAREPVAAMGTVTFEITNCLFFLLWKDHEVNLPSFARRLLKSAMRIAAEEVMEVDLEFYRRVRDELLLPTPAGGYYVDLLERAAPGIVGAIAADPGIVGDFEAVLAEWKPLFEALLDGDGNTAQITPSMVANATALLARVRDAGSDDLRELLDAESAALDPESWSALTGAALLGLAQSQVRSAPSIAVHPVSRSIAAGGPVSFSVSPQGPGPFTYQWRRNGVAIPGATAPTLTLPDAQGAHAGSYTVVVANAFGSTTSSAAALAVNTEPRLINISTRAIAGAGDDTLVVGFYIAGTGTKTLLVRGVGPKLLDFNVPSVVGDPVLVVYSGEDPIDMNEDWDPSLADDFATMGAFALDEGSRDAAMLVTLGPGAYTIHLRNDGQPAEALIEVYDYSRDAGTRLVNLSCRMSVAAGQTTIVGTGLINGPVPLVFRNAGPALGGLDVDGFATDTHLRVFSDGDEVAENDDWDSALAPHFATVGAFGFEPGSRDAALRIEILPGGTTVHATASGGVTLVELYESKD